MRVLAIVNSKAGGGSDVGLYDFVRAIGERGAEITMRFMDVESPIASLVADAGTFDRVVAVGGDGTISSVCYALRDSGVPVLAYPAGTANLLAENLGLPLDPFSLASILLSENVAALDLGEMSYAAEDGEHVVGFVNVAGAGFDAAVMSAAEVLKPTLGPAAYVVGAVQNLIPQTSTFKFTIDGEPHEVDGIAVLVINIPRLQFDITLAEAAHPSDGWLDVAVLRTRNVVTLVPALVSAMFDSIERYAERSDDLRFFRAKEVSVSSDPPQPLQFDGEAITAKTPFTARVLPHAAHLLVPASSPLLAVNAPTEADAG
ncbi:MAG: NAD(+)/NADH kinase [Coriobacteriales bacterium]|nr:NAD(+)/NADH kinase [Coriobacteriales bacterium]